MKNLSYLFTLLFLQILNTVYSQVYEELISDPKIIKTVKLNRMGNDLSDPFISLNSDQKLVLNFDELTDYVKYYNYTIIHCDPDWNSSNLFYSDYINGLENNLIPNSQPSANTLVNYIHHSVTIPNESCQFLRSGNYLLVVSPEDYPDSVVIQKKFVVVEPLVKVQARVVAPPNVQEKDYKQQVLFSVFYDEKLEIDQPFTNLKVSILQNSVWETSINNLLPRFIKNRELDYTHTSGNIFDGNNEYRRFNTKSLYYQDENIQHFTGNRTGYDVYLSKDLKRSFDVYAFMNDIDGKMRIEAEQRNPFIEGEYTWVYFNLDIKHPISNGDFYVFGELSNYQAQESCILNFNPTTQSYQGKVLLKQGFYNYMYGFKEKKKPINLSFIEGNHFETENNYSIIVYYKKTIDDYYRAVNFTNIKSHK